MINKSLIITISLYESLHQYKSFFPEAISIYKNNAIGKFSCDYILDEPKRSIKLRINNSPSYYKDKLDFIEKEELHLENKRRSLKNEPVIAKINKTILINNIMSTLVGIKVFNYEQKKEITRL